MTEKEVKIQQERIEKFNKLKKELTPYNDMIKFIDNFSNSYQKLIIGITCKEFYIYKRDYDNGVSKVEYDKKKISYIFDVVKELLEIKYNAIKEEIDNV